MKALLLLALTTFANGATPIAKAPASASALISPLAGTERARRAGAKLYRRECSACHRTNGEGFGRALPLASSEVHEASPGTLFWVLTNGSLWRGMPSFAHLPERERWQLVEFLKTFP